MLLPSGHSVFAREAWAVVITYDEDGYVKDDDAAKIDYVDLLKKMQQGIRDENDERKRAGYPTVELVGWAEPPRYDSASHKLYWQRACGSATTRRTRSTTTSACSGGVACSC